MCMVKRMGVRQELCWEQERGAVLGKEVAVSGGSCEAPPSHLALQVAVRSLQARQVLASSEAFLKIIAKSSFNLFAGLCVFSRPGIPPKHCSATTGRSKQAGNPL